MGYLWSAISLIFYENGNSGTPNFNASNFAAKSTARIDNSGNIYWTGTYSSSVDFDPGSGSQVLPPDQNIYGQTELSVFLSKVGPTGAYQWTQGSISGQNACVAIDSDQKLIHFRDVRGIYLVYHSRIEKYYQRPAQSRHLMELSARSIFVTH